MFQRVSRPCLQQPLWRLFRSATHLVFPLCFCGHVCFSWPLRGFHRLCTYFGADLLATLEHIGAASLVLTTGQLNGELDLFCRHMDIFSPLSLWSVCSPRRGDFCTQSFFFLPCSPLFWCFAHLLDDVRPGFLAGFLRRFRRSTHTRLSCSQR